MAITSLDELLAGFKPPEDILKGGPTMEAIGILHSHFYSPGRPGAAVAPTTGINGAALTFYAGQIPYTNPTGGQFAYLARFSIAGTIAASWLLLDRLWHNSGIVNATTTLQAIVSPVWPARDLNGATLGEGVMVALEVSTPTSAGTPNTTMTLQYTNSAGVAERTGTIPASGNFPATAVAGTFVPFLLQAGDTGVRSVEGITLAASLGAGVVSLVAYRVLARVDAPLANIGGAVDCIPSGLPRLYDDTVPFIVQVASATTATNVYGQMIVTHG